MSAPGNTRGRPASVWRARDSLRRFARVVGSRVREARHDAGLSVFELARAVGVSSSSFLRDIERGDRLPSLRLLARLAVVLSMDVRELLP